jgi:PKD repeat protein
VASYSWAFGDGATSNLANPTHTYATPGTYTALLTVTDSVGATSTSPVVVTVAPRPIADRPMRVLSMAPSWVSLSRTTGVAQCVVRVVDSGGRPLPGVTLTASVQGLDTATVTVVSDRLGNATLRSAALPASVRGTVTFVVRNVTLPGYTYLPALNKVGTSTVRR